jgi:hypothetical protein
MSGFGIWMEVSKVGGDSIDAIQRKAMQRRAYIHIIAAVLLVGAYWILGEEMNVFTPSLVVFRTGMLFLLTLLGGLALAEFSRAFAILALLTMRTP